VDLRQTTAQGDEENNHLSDPSSSQLKPQNQPAGSPRRFFSVGGLNLWLCPAKPVVRSRLALPERHDATLFLPAPVWNAIPDGAFHFTMFSRRGDNVGPRAVARWQNMD